MSVSTVIMVLIYGVHQNAPENVPQNAPPEKWMNSSVKNAPPDINTMTVINYFEQKKSSFCQKKRGQKGQKTDKFEKQKV